MLRPDLLASEAARKRFAKVASALGNDEAVGGLTAAATFPSISVSGTASVTIAAGAGTPNAVAKVTEGSHDLVLVDLDAKAAHGKLDHAAVGKLVRAGKFDPEFALLTMRGERWAFYDTDGKDGMDVVLFAPRGASAPTVGYRLAKGGEVQSIPPGTSLAQWGRFEGKFKTRFEAIARGWFRGQASEG